MGTKISINLEESIVEFLNGVTDNRSAYINNLIAKEQQKIAQQRLRECYREQASDPEFLQEIQAWDSTAGDGLNDSVEGMVKYF